jgi:hypothetical protein
MASQDTAATAGADATKGGAATAALDIDKIIEKLLEVRHIETHRIARTSQATIC